MTIKHLVISGGGATGIKSLGILQNLEINDFWKIENIQTIYATSAGAIVALLIALKFDWQSINDYILLRRWHEVFPIGINEIFDAFSKKGLIQDEISRTFFKPFFLAKDLSLDTTMKEFFEYSNIDLHFFSLELNSFQIENISYKTFPDLSILKAIHMTCALPVVISPVIFEGKCYVDGGVIHNYPLNICIEEQGYENDYDEILAIKNNYSDDENQSQENKSNNKIGDESSMLDYIMIFINKLIMSVDTEGKQKSVKYELQCKTSHISLDTLKSALYSADFRKELLESGMDTGKKFLLSLSNEEQLDSSIQKLS